MIWQSWCKKSRAVCQRQIAQEGLRNLGNEFDVSSGFAVSKKLVWARRKVEGKKSKFSVILYSRSWSFSSFLQSTTAFSAQRFILAKSVTSFKKHTFTITEKICFDSFAKFWWAIFPQVNLNTQKLWLLSWKTKTWIILHYPEKQCIGNSWPEIFKSIFESLRIKIAHPSKRAAKVSNEPHV